MSQENSRFASTLNVNGTTYAYYPVSAVAGSEQLPYSLTVLLENVLRNAETPEAAEELAARIVEAGRAGVVGSANKTRTRIRTAARSGVRTSHDAGVVSPSAPASYTMSSTS